MKLSIKNVCSIETADIELNGLTIVAGKNNTGKSTISKSLFTIFSSVYDLIRKRNNEFMERLEKALFKININAIGMERVDKLCIQLCSMRNEMIKKNNGVINENVKEKVNGLLLKYLENITYDADEYTNVLNEVMSIFDYSDDNYNCDIVNKYINDEFMEKICNVVNDNNKSSIELYLKEDKNNIGNYLYNNKISIIDNVVKNVKVEMPIVHHAYYYDSLNVDYNLDLHNYFHLKIKNKYNHKYLFDKEIHFNDINNNNNISKSYDSNNFDKYFEIFGEIGDIYVETSEVYYKEKKFKEAINPHQMAQGMKSLVVIRQLLRNKTISDKDVLILDEPEMNLHPEWQVLFAQLICKLQQDKNLTVLICSHSPYFISAIKKYVNDNNRNCFCNYYLMNRDVANETIKVIDATKCPDIIFKNLYEPILPVIGENIYEK